MNDSKLSLLLYCFIVENKSLVQTFETKTVTKTSHFVIGVRARSNLQFRYLYETLRLMQYRRKNGNQLAWFKHHVISEQLLFYYWMCQKLSYI